MAQNAEKTNKKVRNYNCELFYFMPKFVSENIS